MKQHITEEQWLAIDFKQRDLFWKVIDGSQTTASDERIEQVLPDIGRMIQFLMDDWKNKVSVEQQIYFANGSTSFQHLLPINSELCDALWEAVKEKLTQ